MAFIKTSNGPPVLSSLKWQWDEGNRFALVEAIAVCAAYGWEYPEWVRGLIDDAMTNLFRAVHPRFEFPDEPPWPSLDLELNATDRKIAERLRKELPQSLDILGLTTDKANAIQRRNKVLRDYHLACEVAERCRLVPKLKPQFRGVNKAIRSLVEELASEETWRDKGRYRLPGECLGASEDTIKRAWSKHRDWLVEVYLDSI